MLEKLTLPRKIELQTDKFGRVQIIFQVDLLTYRNRKRDWTYQLYEKETALSA